MFSFEEYMIGWVIYLASALMLITVFWHFTRKLRWFYTKQSLRLVLATVLLVPAAVENADGYLAPAWVKAILQLVFSGMDGFLPVGRLILLAILTAFTLYLLLLIAQTLYRRKYPLS